MIRVKGPRLLVLPRDPIPEVHAAGSPDLILLGETDSGLVKAAPATQTYQPAVMGKVLQVGDEPCCPHCHKGVPFEVKVGDVVVFSPSAGDMVYFDDQRYLIIDHRDVSAVLTKEVAA